MPPPPTTIAIRRPAWGRQPVVPHHQVPEEGREGGPGRRPPLGRLTHIRPQPATRHRHRSRRPVILLPATPPRPFRTTAWGGLVARRAPGSGTFVPRDRGGAMPPGGGGGVLVAEGKDRRGQHPNPHVGRLAGGRLLSSLTCALQYGSATFSSPSLPLFLPPPRGVGSTDACHRVWVVACGWGGGCVRVCVCGKCIGCLWSGQDIPKNAPQLISKTPGL